MGIPDGGGVANQARGTAGLDPGVDFWGTGESWITKDLKGPVENPSTTEVSVPLLPRT